MEVSHGLHLLGRETRLSVRLAQCIEKCVELTVEHRIEVVRLESDAVIGDAVLGEVVGADALRTVHRPNLTLATVRRFNVRGFPGDYLPTACKDLAGALLVLELRTLVLAGDDDAGRKVRDSDSRVGRVDALTALAGRTVDVDTQVTFVDLDLLDLFGLRVDQNAGSRSVNAPLGFGDGHSLDAVNAALELQPRPHSVRGVRLALDRQRGFLVSAEIGDRRVENLHAPAVPFALPDVHAGQVRGEERGFFAALTGLHF